MWQMRDGDPGGRGTAKGAPSTYPREDQASRTARVRRVGDRDRAGDPGFDGAPDPDPDREPQPLIGARILFVDDDPLAREYVRGQLGARHEVVVAADADGAVAAVQQARPDLIMLDVVLPGTDGFEVYRRLQGHVELRDVPVMFITGHASAQVELRALQIGAVDQLTKPVPPTVLLSRVDEHLWRSRLERGHQQLRVELAAELEAWQRLGCAEKPGPRR